MSAALQKIIKDLRGYSEWAGKPDALEEAISALEAQQAQARAIQECYGDCAAGNPKTCPNPCSFQGRPKP